MTLPSRHQRSPLGAFYRTPLGAFGPGVELPAALLDTTSPFLSASEVTYIDDQCRLARTLPGGLLAAGTWQQALNIPPAEQARPVTDWINATYSGSGITYTPSAITAFHCIQPANPPLLNEHNHRYAGAFNVVIDASRTAYDVVVVVRENLAQTARDLVTFYWNHTEWPASFNGVWPHPSQVQATFA